MTQPTISCVDLPFAGDCSSGSIPSAIVGYSDNGPSDDGGDGTTHDMCAAAAAATTTAAAAAASAATDGTIDCTRIITIDSEHAAVDGNRNLARDHGFTQGDSDGILSGSDRVVVKMDGCAVGADDVIAAPMVVALHTASCSGYKTISEHL